jgi:cobalt-zinc-cadmium efflux system membrane fusion protein
MNRIFRMIAIPLILVIAAPASGAEQLVIAETGIRNLGVETVPPRSADAVAGIEARARVVIPPAREHAVASMTDGIVATVHRTAGETVARGDLLAEIRSNQFIALQREYVAAVVEADLAASQLTRDRQLVDEGIVSLRRLEETRAAASAARARRNEARELLLQAGMIPAELEAIATRQAFRRTLPLRSPIDGVVTVTKAVTGQEVRALAALYRVADLTTLWLEIQVPGEALSRIAEGTPVALSSGDGSRIGRVLSVGRVVDPETQLAVARAELTDADTALRPGQLVSVVVGTDDEAGGGRSVTVPVSAVVRSGDSAYVFVRNDRGFLVHPVDITGTEGGRVFLSDAPGGEIAVSGVAALKALWLSGEGDAD